MSLFLQIFDESINKLNVDESMNNWRNYTLKTKFMNELFINLMSVFMNEIMNELNEMIEKWSQWIQTEYFNRGRNQLIKYIFNINKICILPNKYFV